jgi:hypothetical protein
VEGRTCSLRAILLGLLLCALMAAAIPWGDMVIKGSQFGVWNTTPGAIFLFVLLAGAVNALVGWVAPRLALDRGELAVVFIMLLVANTLPARGFAAYVPAVATGATYYATPENDWAQRVLPYLPDFSTIRDEEIVQQYYEGTGAGGSVPWDAWLGPLAYWVLFGLALYLVMISVTVILHRQWSRNERLVYPMMQLPLHVLQEEKGARRRALLPFFRQWSVWLGFLLPCFIVNVNALHDYLHYVPQISTSFGAVPLFRNSITVGFSLSFTMLGFSYLISRNIAAGLIFFYLLSVVQQGTFRMLGVQIDAGPVGAFGHYAQPVIIYQALGGMLVLVLMGLYNARHHLRDVARRAFLGAADVDDRGEMLSYRQAVGGLLLGTGVMTLWLWRAGLPVWIAPVLLVLCFVLFLTITRVVVEGGVAVMFPPITGPDATAALLGTAALGPGGAAALSTTYVWGTDVLILLMTSCANGLKVADRFLQQKRRLFWAIGAAIVVTLAVSLAIRLEAGYEHGAINLNAFYADNAAQYPYRFMAEAVHAPVGAHWDGILLVAVGAAVMALLELLHYKFLWWPFHPLGFPISAAFAPMWFSLFVAWLLKSLVLKYGGPQLYRATVPFFLGMILGEIVPAGLWLIVDFVTGMNGNVLGSFLF